MQRLEWSRVYYHFVRIHSSLSLGWDLPKELRERTPAMAAGLTDRRWRTLDILRLPLVAEDTVLKVKQGQPVWSGNAGQKVAHVSKCHKPNEAAYA